MFLKLLRGPSALKSASIAAGIRGLPRTFSSARCALGGVIAGAIAFEGSRVLAESSSQPQAAAKERKQLQRVPPRGSSSFKQASEAPEYTLDEIEKHTNSKVGIWMVHNNNVYDVTEFVQSHPGGEEKIMLAAGGSVEPFWAIYTQHMLSNMVPGILAKHFIGTVKQDDRAKALSTVGDPYANDPRRVPALMKLAHGKTPFNCETIAEAIPENYITPTALWYVRHHHPVPDINEDDFRLELTTDDTTTGEGLKTLRLSVADLKRLPQHTITATMQCGGNRRAEFNEIEKAQGLPWKVGAISTAVWTGVRLKDLLESMGLDPKRTGARHVQFLGEDPPYDASIPIRTAVAEDKDVLLALEMNGRPIPRDHGYPVRAIVPGTIGARNVKWVGKVVVSKEEAHSGWQRGVQYKGFAPGLKDFKHAQPSKTASCQEMPVTSSICLPQDGSVVGGDGEDSMVVEGYAWSGGGRGIVRVDVSADDGETWQTAEFKQVPEEARHTGAPDDTEEMRGVSGREWAWSLWQAELPIPKGEKQVTLLCKATDSSYNAQPNTAKHIWNKRGILNNAWHRVTVKVAGPQ